MPDKTRDLFSFPKCPDRFWDLISHLFIEYQHSFLNIMQKDREVNHSPLSRAEVKN
jgi:hypothetical protein